MLERMRNFISSFATPNNFNLAFVEAVRVIVDRHTSLEKGIPYVLFKTRVCLILCLCNHCSGCCSCCLARRLPYITRLMLHASMLLLMFWSTLMLLLRSTPLLLICSTLLL